MTVVEGVINLDYFDVAFRADLSDCIGTIEDKDIPFSSVCRSGPFPFLVGASWNVEEALGGMY